MNARIGHNKIGPILFVQLVMIFGCSATEANLVSQPDGPVEGGPCVYAEYSGKAEIVRVEKTARSSNQAAQSSGPGYEGYEVWFRYLPQGIIPPSQRQMIGGDHLLTLKNGWYVGLRYLKKYAIRKGRVFDCRLKIIQKGTCTPVLFEIQDLDTADYFESKP